jgi:hypothetical protein
MPPPTGDKRCPPLPSPSSRAGHPPPHQGGNDYEIFTSEETVGHTVTSPDDTRKQCTELFMS